MADAQQSSLYDRIAALQRRAALASQMTHAGQSTADVPRIPERLSAALFTPHPVSSALHDPEAFNYIINNALGIGVIKPVGGQWLGTGEGGALTQMLNALKRRVRTPGVNYHTEANAAQDVALNSWVQGPLRKYILNRMASPEDEIRKLAEQGVTHVPSTQLSPNTSYWETPAAGRQRAGFPRAGLATTPEGAAWENASDKLISEAHPGRDPADQLRMTRDEASMASDLPWVSKLDPKTPLYYQQPNARIGAELGFDHLLDVLSSDLQSGALRPEQLSKVSVAQAVQRAHDFNLKQAEAMKQQQLQAAMGPAVHTVRDYPDSDFHWVELKKPDISAVDTSEFRQGKNHGRDVWLDPSGIEMKLDPAEQALQDALTYEGNTMGHCVGGYCPDVAEGNTRIFSLRNKQTGEPHVTVEVAHSRITPDDAFQDFNEVHGRDPDDDELLQWQNELMDRHGIKESDSPSIIQIKGKQNAAPVSQYLPYVHDFVRNSPLNAPWSKVGDLQNTGLVKTSDVLAGRLDPAFGGRPMQLNDYEARRRALATSPHELPDYVTPEEWFDALNNPPQGMAQGGRVSTGKITKSEVLPRIPIDLRTGKPAKEPPPGSIDANPQAQASSTSLTDEDLAEAQPGEHNLTIDAKGRWAFAEGGSVSKPKQSRTVQQRISELHQRAHAAATSPLNDHPEPTDPQKHAGNYRKGHVSIAGMNVSIENPAGSRRRPEWPPLAHHYGYIRGTVGRDKDHIDVFVAPDTPLDYSGPVFVVDQKKPANGHFDEHKVMLGFKTVADARRAYLQNYSKGWTGLRAVTTFINPQKFREWLQSGDTKQPAALVEERHRT